MKTPTVLTMVMLALTACGAPGTPETAATQTSHAGIPNPASVHCRETGNRLDVQTAADGSQHGSCVFPNGSACDEWAFFRNICGPASPATAATASQPDGTQPATTEPDCAVPAGATETVVDWWGVIRKTDAGGQFDDYFERRDLGQPIDFGIDSRDSAVEAQIVALRDSGKIVQVSGTLYSAVPDVNGSQILVVCLVVAE